MSNQDSLDHEQQLNKEQENLATIENQSQELEKDREQINEQGLINQSKDTFITNEDNQDLQKQEVIINNQISLEQSQGQSIGSNRKKRDGSNNGDEPNDIDDDLIFSQNTFETGDQVRPGEKEQTDSIFGQQISKNEGSIHKKFEDSLERNDNFMFQSNQKQPQEIKNKKPNISQQQNETEHIKIQNQEDTDNISNQIKDKRQKLINDPNIINQLIGSDNEDHSKQIHESDHEKIKQLIHVKDEFQQSLKTNENEDKQMNNLNPEQQFNNSKLITFQSENIQEPEQYNMENQSNKQNNYMMKTQIRNEEEQNNIHIVNEESKDVKGSIIPPQTNIHLDPKEYSNEQVNQKKFDYQQLEGFLKNQKKNLVYPSSTIESQNQQTNNKTISLKIPETAGNGQSLLMNKGNSSRSAALNLNSENFKFSVQPIINSSQFQNEEQNTFSSNKEERFPFNDQNNSARNKKISESGTRLQYSRVGKGNQQESLQTSEDYQSNFYESNNQLKDKTEQTFISISNSSQPSNIVNKFNSNRNYELNSQEQLGTDMQKQNAKRFTNVKESINDEQDIPEELSSYSKNTIQRYMTEQVISYKEFKKQSTASMLTVESKDMEAATQEQVRKMVTEQVENMIRSKLNGQSGQKQDNMIFNNEELFRQVIREELHNFLKGNANVQSPSSMNNFQSVNNNQSRQNDGRQYKQNERTTNDKKQSISHLSQKEQEKDQSYRDTRAPSTAFLNNDEINDIIDESIQKHQQAQLQNRQNVQNVSLQNKQINQPFSNQLLQDQKYSKSTGIINQNYRPDNRIQDERIQGDSIQNLAKGNYPISLVDEKTIQGNQNKKQVFKQKQLYEIRSNNTQNQQNALSYKDQYKIFKTEHQNEDGNRNQNPHTNIQNFAQNYQIPQRQNQNYYSQISSENSPHFAREKEKDPLKLVDLSFNFNNQQSQSTNQRHLQTNDSQNSNMNIPKNIPHSNSKNSLYQNRNEVKSRSSNQSIPTFANPQPIHLNKYGRENQQGNQNQNESSQRDTQPDERPTSTQSSYIKNDKKINYQDLIANPPKRNLYMQQQSSYESDNQDHFFNYQNLMESSIYNKNNDEYNSLDSNKNRNNQNSNRNIFVYSRNQKFQNDHKVQNKQLPQSQQQNNYQPITQIWEKALDFQQRGQLNRAYQMLLDIEDDIYLLRMMSKTGPCFSKLNQNIGKKLLRRINKISQSQFMDNLSLQLIQKSYEEDLLQDLNLEDSQSVKEILYEISASQNIGERAAMLYNLIDQAEHN